MDIFSRRLHRLPPYMFGKLKQLTYERRQQGIGIIDLGMGNPDKPTPQHVVDKLSEAAQEARHHRYSASRGLFNLRREIAWHTQRRLKFRFFLRWPPGMPYPHTWLKARFLAMRSIL